jgi:hypothetical protein
MGYTVIYYFIVILLATLLESYKMKRPSISKNRPPEIAAGSHHVLLGRIQAVILAIPVVDDISVEALAKLRRQRLTARSADCAENTTFIEHISQLRRQNRRHEEHSCEDGPCTYNCIHTTNAALEHALRLLFHD